MNIEQLLKVIESIKTLNSDTLPLKRETPFEIGQVYLIRTVTMMHIGKVKEIIGDFIILEQDSWIADSGRFHDALKYGVEILSEVEPYLDDVGVGVGSIVDFTVWKHDLPKEQK